jgi:hypothetical protein
MPGPSRKSRKAAQRRPRRRTTANGRDSRRRIKRRVLRWGTAKPLRNKQAVALQRARRRLAFGRTGAVIDLPSTFEYHKEL